MMKAQNSEEKDAGNPTIDFELSREKADAGTGNQANEGLATHHPLPVLGFLRPSVGTSATALLWPVRPR